MEGRGLGLFGVQSPVISLEGLAIGNGQLNLRTAVVVKAACGSGFVIGVPEEHAASIFKMQVGGSRFCPKCRYPSTKQHGVIAYKTVF